jgi:predicted transcriptional regulator
VPANPVVGVRVPDELRRQLRERAELEDRPEGQVIRHALKAYLRGGQTVTDDRPGRQAA